MIASKICWAITLLVSCAAALGLLATFATAASAPQEAAGAAMVAASCIVPYVFTRCVEGLERPAVATVDVRQPALDLTRIAPDPAPKPEPRFGG